VGESEGNNRRDDLPAGISAQRYADWTSPNRWIRLRDLPIKRQLLVVPEKRFACQRTRKLLRKLFWLVIQRGADYLSAFFAIERFQTIDAIALNQHGTARDRD
jgi:hypothetical protein